MQTHTSSASEQVRVGSVVALWRYPVKSMMGEELNATEITDRGLLGDRRFAVVDRSTGKVGGAKNPRKWGNFFDFRAAYVEAPKTGAKISPVRITLPDGTAVTSEQPDLEQILSRAFGRDVALQEARPGQMTSGATAEEYWPDIAGLDQADAALAQLVGERQEVLQRPHRAGQPGDDEYVALTQVGQAPIELGAGGVLAGGGVGEDLVASVGGQLVDLAVVFLAAGGHPRVPDFRHHAARA
jgi:hypothetical protein